MKRQVKASGLSVEDERVRFMGVIPLITHSQLGKDVIRVMFFTMRLSILVLVLKEGRDGTRRFSTTKNLMFLRFPSVDGSC